MNNDLATLKTVQLFHTMDDQEITGLRSVMGEQRFVAGQVIMREGELGDLFHVIAEGKVQFVTHDASGQEVILGDAGPGGFFGELSMLTGEPRAGRVKAIDAVRTLTLNQQELQQFLLKHPHAAIDMLTEMARRLYEADRLVRHSTTRNLNEVADERMTFGDRIADGFASMMGSWAFIIIQTVLLIFWVVFNLLQATKVIHWDEYPFIFLNLALSFQAAYAAPIIMMSQNRSSNKDRLAAEIDHQVNIRAEMKAGLLMSRLDDLERGMHALHEKQIAEYRNPNSETRNPNQ
jgi:CRP/FNR family transcriptional regulator, cyclic AMP receptor protein